ncbi:MAG TPA: hypothetical protein VHU84_10595 [Lacipirellulaceae bacterium]|nr:hypothetical protein [Lacipirellulaceae bacterium]
MILLLLLLQVVADAPATTKGESPKFVRKLSQAKLEPSLLGSDWKPVEGLVVDDVATFDFAKALPANLAGQLQQTLKASGITSVGSYCIARKDFPPDAVTVEVYVFADEDKCNVWWKKKYQSTDWQKSYRTVASPNMTTLDTVDNNEFPNNKRIAKFGNQVVLSGHIRKSDEHLKALENILEQLTSKEQEADTMGKQ